MLDLEAIAAELYGREFARWMLAKKQPLEMLFRLADEGGVVLLPGQGFGTLHPSARVSLANLNEDDYTKIGRVIRRLAEEYYQEFKRHQRDAAAAGTPHRRRPAARGTGEEALTMLHAVLSARPELAIFAALVVGYAIGAIKLGPFQLGGVAGTLLAALVIGQIGVQIDPSLQRFMFTLFIYALGFSVAPQFFASVDRTTWTWGLLVVIEVVLIVVRGIRRHVAVQAGCRDGERLAGRIRDRVRHGRYRERGDRQVGIFAAQATQTLQANVATAYALSYIFSLITIVLFASQAAPRLLGIDLRKEARLASGQARRCRSQPRSGSELIPSLR